MNVDISQSVAEPQKQAQDKIVVPEQSGEQIKQAPKEKSVKPSVNKPLSSKQKPPNSFEQELIDTKKALKPAKDRKLADKPEQPKSFEQELIDTKKALKPAKDRKLADKPEQPKSFEQELIDTKKALKPAEKRVLADKPEQPRNMTLIDELRSVADGTKHTNGNLVPSKVVDEVQKLRRNIEDNKSQSQVAKSQSQSRKVGHATGMSADNSKGRG